MITTVNLNPTWTVPLSIAKKDIITKMRKDPGYLARMHIRPLDAQGNEIDPRTIDWNSDRSPNFTLRQDSGTWNALGAVKIDQRSAQWQPKSGPKSESESSRYTDRRRCEHHGIAWCSCHEGCSDCFGGQRHSKCLDHAAISSPGRSA